MVRIAFASDLHFDVNQLDAKKLIQQQIDFLNRQEVDYFFVTGDTFNDFNKTLEYFEQFNNLARNTKAYFIAGNHDMVRGVKYYQLEEPQSKYYLHHKTLLIPDTNFAIVGNNGWYDYSFAKTRLNLTDNDYYHFKQTYWVDAVIDAPLSDRERFDRTLAQIEESIEQVQAVGQPNRHIILLTHFVPRLEFIKFTDYEKWNISTAMLGGVGLGELIDRYQLDYVDFGHLHIRTPDTQIGQTTYLHQPLGYRTKRRHEWENADFMTEFMQTTKIIEIN